MLLVVLLTRLTIKTKLKLNKLVMEKAVWT
jgi:hypothetical protein